VDRPMLARACGCVEEFQVYKVDKYLKQRRAKFQSTRCPACVEKSQETHRQAHVPKGEAFGRLPAGAVPLTTFYTLRCAFPAMNLTRFAIASTADRAVDARHHGDGQLHAEDLRGHALLQVHLTGGGPHRRAAGLRRRPGRGVPAPRDG